MKSNLERHFTHNDFFSWAVAWSYIVPSLRELRREGKTGVYEVASGVRVGTAYCYSSDFITFYPED